MLEYFMNVKLPTEHHLGFLSLKGFAQARLRLHLSKYHIVGNHMSRHKCYPPTREGASLNLILHAYAICWLIHCHLFNLYVMSWP